MGQRERKGRARKVRPNEEFARIIIQKVIGKPVRHFDDGSADSMFDLIVGDEFPKIAIECVRATDPNMRAIGSAVKRGIPISPFNLTRSWSVRFNRSLDIKQTRRLLPATLQRLESLGIHDTTALGFSSVVDHLISQLEELGIERAHAFDRVGEPEIVLLPDGIGGFVDETGGKVPEWISDFLRHDSKQDVLFKLEKALSIDSREVFIECDMYGAPWHVVDYLTGSMTRAPQNTPDLPEPITGVWLGYGFRGIRWDGHEWAIFDVRQQV